MAIKAFYAKLKQLKFTNDLAQSLKAEPIYGLRIRLFSKKNLNPR